MPHEAADTIEAIWRHLQIKKLEPKPFWCCIVMSIANAPQCRVPASLSPNFLPALPKRHTKIVIWIKNPELHSSTIEQLPRSPPPRDIIKVCSRHLGQAGGVDTAEMNLSALLLWEHLNPAGTDDCNKTCFSLLFHLGTFVHLHYTLNTRCGKWIR